MKIATIISATVFLPFVVSAQAQAALVVKTSPAVSLTATAEKLAVNSGTRGTVSADKKTITFRQKRIALTAVSGPASDMLSYRIAGLKNPTLVVPEGATLTVRFINTDDDMTHNLRFGSQHTASTPSVGTPDLAHRTQSAFRAATVTVRAPEKQGTYYYFCTVPGHAQGGMWGTLRVL